MTGRPADQASEPDDPFGTGRIRAAVLGAWRSSRTRFREDANSEEDLRYGGYRDRVAVELAQNAADAALEAGVPGELLVTIAEGGAGPELRVANTGRPLDARGVEALSSLRASTKAISPEATSGRFGVGFAAVLAVTEEPRIVSRDGGVRFSAAATRSEITAIPDLADLVAARDGAVPVLRLPWPAPPGEPGPPAGFTTEVRLPLAPGVDGEALLAVFRDQAEDLLLALPGLRRVRVGADDWSCEETPLAPPAPDPHPGDAAAPHPPLALSRIVVRTPDGARRWLVASASGELRVEPTALGVESRRTDWSVRWAVPTAAQGTPDPLSEDVLHAPTGTDEATSLPARLLADVPLEPSRRRVLPGPVTDAVLAEAARAYPALLLAAEESDRTELVPRPGFPRSDVDSALREGVLTALRAERWLPSADGRRVAPAGARVFPDLDAELGVALAPLLPGLVAPSVSHRRAASALAALGVERVSPADVVEELAGIARPPSWWRSLYTALSARLAEDPDRREALGGLPVPLVDGRTATGPRDVLLPAPGLVDAEELAEAEITGLRLAHPEVDHPLLRELGAREAGPAELLDSEPLRAAVDRSLDDADAGIDVASRADLVLRLVAESGGSGTRPWLAALALPTEDGDWARADEVVLPGSPLRAVLAEDSPLATLDAAFADRWPAPVLVEVGVLETFAVLHDEHPTGPDHDLADEEEWWDAAGAEDDGPRELIAVRDLDLVDDHEWPSALRLLRARPDTWRAVTATGYTSWWLARHALLAGRPPREWRLDSATALAGLHDPVPDLGLAGEHGGVTLDPVAVTELLVAAGVRAGLRVEDAEDAEDLLGRLGDRGRDVSEGVALRAHAELAVAVRSGRVSPEDVDPPDHVRSLTGGCVPADEAVVLDGPWFLAVADAARLVAAGGDGRPENGSSWPGGAGAGTGVATGWASGEDLARLLDLPLASELWGAEPVGAGRPAELARLAGGAAVADLLALPGEGEGAPVVLVHDGLEVVCEGRRHQVPWWVDGTGRAHATDTPRALAAALAWNTGQWSHRHLLAALLVAPTTATLLG
ncbi:sacsin N-terminal ATP-binding-like domain-containing protein [Actinoalloteichus caeruleus]|uniref:sacsin N-terminal ATP-binding-like domain-containing protein n=1 Tax=Actinoalloteichus cyanogriseus TaxID=2893586 RepID=UPI0006906D2E|nr:ATP-binding protein [Actinoalloteichus caeruleus]